VKLVQPVLPVQLVKLDQLVILVSRGPVAQPDQLVLPVRLVKLDILVTLVSLDPELPAPLVQLVPQETLEILGQQERLEIPARLVQLVKPVIPVLLELLAHQAPLDRKGIREPQERLVQPGPLELAPLVQLVVPVILVILFLMLLRLVARVLTF